MNHGATMNVIQGNTRKYKAMLPILAVLTITALHGQQPESSKPSTEKSETTSKELGEETKEEVNETRVLKNADRAELKTIVVTAQKRKKNDLEVAASLTALDENDIEDRQIRNFNDLSQSTAGVSTLGADSYANPILIRNIGGEFITFTNARIGLYVDEVPYFNIGSYPQDLWQLQSVEVLRGPQGTLYGRGALAGVINLKTKDPGNEIEYYGLTDYSNFDGSNARSLQEVKLSHGLSFPIIQDKLSMRVAGYFKHGNGYLENSTLKEGDPEVTAGGANVKILANVSDKLEISYMMNANVTQQDPFPYTLDLSTRSVERNRNSNTEAKNLVSALNAKLDLNAISISSVTAFNGFRFDSIGLDSDYSAADIGVSNIGQEHLVGSQEIRVSSNELSIPLNFVAGLFASYAEYKETSNTGFAGFNISSNGDFTIKNYAAFGEAGFDFLGFGKSDHSLELTVGGRYDAEKVDATGFAGSLAGMVNYDVNGDYQAFSPKVALQYGYLKSYYIFTGVSRGFKAGGVNSFPTSTTNAEYNPEFLSSYEAGAKLIAFKRRLKTSLTAFYLDYKDAQIRLYSLNANTGSFSQVIENAAAADSTGFEWELQFRPFLKGEYLTGLLFEGNMSYNPIRFTTYQSRSIVGSVINNSGNQLPAASDVTAFIAFEYSFPFAISNKNEIYPFIRIDSSYRSGYFSEADNPADIFQKAFGLLGAQIGFRSENIDFRIWGKNLLNEYYFTYGTGILKNFRLGAAYNIGQPRSFGVSLTSRF